MLEPVGVGVVLDVVSVDSVPFDEPFKSMLKFLVENALYDDVELVWDSFFFSCTTCVSSSSSAPKLRVSGRFRGYVCCCVTNFSVIFYFLVSVFDLFKKLLIYETFSIMSALKFTMLFVMLRFRLHKLGISMLSLAKCLASLK